RSVAPLVLLTLLLHDTAPTVIYTLSLHDALPIWLSRIAGTAPAFIPWAWGINGFASVASASMATLLAIEFGFRAVVVLALVLYRSEEHTSELQSRENLVCRLLLEKKKTSQDTKN